MVKAHGEQEQQLWVVAQNWQQEGGR